MVVILDLDGVIWLGTEAVPGSRQAVHRLRAAGRSVLFVTNNSSPTVADNTAKLASFGVDVDPGAVVTSSQAAARLVAPGSTALVCAGPGVAEALEDRGVSTVREGAADAVVVGFHRDFDFARLTAAFRAVHGGARLIGTNDDATYPTVEGPVPGGGSLLAAVAYASGVRATVAGKPHEPIADLVRERVGDLDGAVMIGDRPSTDGLMARRLGIPYVQVLSGVTEAPEASGNLTPDFVFDDLAAYTDDLLGPDPQELA